MPDRLRAAFNPAHLGGYCFGGYRSIRRSGDPLKYGKTKAIASIAPKSFRQKAFAVRRFAYFLKTISRFAFLRCQA
jgi:hypothetical protein